MAIKAVVDTLDEIAEPLREHYTQVGDKFQLTVDGMKPLDEFNRVYGGLTKERNDHKETKTKLQSWAALGTAEEVQAKLDRIAELEAAAGGKLDDAAIEKLVSTRLTSKTAPLERNIQTLTQQLQEKDQLIQSFQAEKKQRTIHDNLREALKKHEGFQQSAFDDAAMLAERMFDVDEEGRVVTKDGVGVTPGVDAAVWLTEMQQKRPHWWGPSAGGGAGGSGRNNTPAGNNPWSADNWNMTEQAKIFRENPKRAEQLAKSAGTTVGGMRPVKK